MAVNTSFTGFTLPVTFATALSLDISSFSSAVLSSLMVAAQLTALVLVDLGTVSREPVPQVIVNSDSLIYANEPSANGGEIKGEWRM